MLASDAPLVQALGLIEKRAKELAEAMAGHDLLSDVGRAEAIKTQGTILGLRLAIDTILQPVRDYEDARSESRH